MRSPTFRLALHSRTVHLRINAAAASRQLSPSERSTTTTKKREKRRTGPDDRAVLLDHLHPLLVHVNLERDAVREHDAISRPSGTHAPSDAGHKSGLQARPASQVPEGSRVFCSAGGERRRRWQWRLRRIIADGGAARLS